MPAPKGNQYWRLSSVHGRSTEYTPEELLEKSNEYFQWCEDNPLQKEEIVKYRDHHSKDSVNLMRAFTIEGLCNFLDITVETFRQYGKREEFIAVTTRIRQVIKNQKFEGAAAGLLQPMIIARDLGLKDQTDVTTNGESVNTDKIMVATQEDKERIERLLKKFEDE